VSINDVLPSRRYLFAWGVPAVVIALVVAGTAVFSAGPASGHPVLPKLSAAQLLARVQTARAPALSGTVRATTALGLPDLPGGDESASLSWTSLITGTHTARVWLDGADKQRVAILGTLSEADVIHNGRDLWTYTSTSNEASHTLLPAAESRRPERATGSQTPIDVANSLLKAITPSTSVTVDTTQVVAGRDAYTLVVRPRDHVSTIRKVTIAVDSLTFVPLRLQVFGAGSAPAFQLGFTSVSFATPSASIFDFHIPAGATVVTNPLQTRHMREHRATASGTAGTTKAAAPKIIGSNWDSVVEFPDGAPGVSGGLLDRFAHASGPAGERVISTALVNGVLMPDGRLFVGAVTVSQLEHVAATTR
jgi:outer membrane lipoprotein-sorting protein